MTDTQQKPGPERTVFIAKQLAAGVSANRIAHLTSRNPDMPRIYTKSPYLASLTARANGTAVLLDAPGESSAVLRIVLSSAEHAQAVADAFNYGAPPKWACADEEMDITDWWQTRMDEHGAHAESVKGYFSHAPVECFNARHEVIIETACYLDGIRVETPSGRVTYYPAEWVREKMGNEAVAVLEGLVE